MLELSVCDPLDRPVYVLKMHRGRWSAQAREKWLRILRESCYETIARINDELDRTKRAL